MIKQRVLFTGNEIAPLVSGQVIHPCSVKVSISQVDIDSRKVAPGSLFIALPGERTDGHNYICSAGKSGAKMIIVEKSTLPKIADSLALLKQQNIAIVAVQNSLTALQKLASAWVDKFSSLKRLAVTGSNGKTTTKEMIGAILSQLGPTVKTPGNYNSEIGLPLSMFHINADHEYGVFEMGINHPGEMDTLVDIYKPEISIMTNIGTAHIGNMGSIEGIAREKSKIFHSGVRNGYVYEENIWKSYMRSLRGLEFREFGKSGTKGFKGAQNLGLQGWRIRYEDRVFRLKHVGIHNLLDALAAIAVTRDLGAEPKHIAEALESLEPMSGRSRVVRGDVTVVEDCYNANVDSTRDILNYIGNVPWKGRKTAILGSMKELGDKANTAHAYIGKKLSRTDISAAFLFGEEMESAYRVLKTNGSVGKVFFTESFEELENAVSSYVSDGDLLLLKGSRSMRLERLLRTFGMAS